MERRAPRISIHAPRVGGDMEKLKSKISNTISIHAPRVGGDSVRHFTLPGFHYFNPRPPCGGRQTSLNNSSRCVEFQSTPPVWGATLLELEIANIANISIHAPRVGGDQAPFHAGPQCFDFNPRPPCGGRLAFGLQCGVFDYFNPRPPCGGRPTPSLSIMLTVRISIHAPRVGGDLRGA